MLKYIDLIETPAIISGHYLDTYCNIRFRHYSNFIDAKNYSYYVTNTLKQFEHKMEMQMEFFS